MKLIGKKNAIRKLLNDAIRSSFHYAIASVNEDGSPHITPIGSLLLVEENKGIYFEIFTTKLPKNIRTNQKICVLAVNSSKFFWLISLFLGKFISPPAIRLIGTAGERRKASEEEKKLWNRRVGLIRFLKGYNLLWGNLHYVREIYFDSIDPILLGKMTSEKGDI